jgi:hypothetical protein
LYCSIANPSTSCSLIAIPFPQPREAPLRRLLCHARSHILLLLLTIQMRRSAFNLLLVSSLLAVFLLSLPLLLRQRLLPLPMPLLTSYLMHRMHWLLMSLLRNAPPHSICTGRPLPPHLPLMLIFLRIYPHYLLLLLLMVLL